jgi:hypothetical protein
VNPRAWALVVCAAVNLYLLGVMVLFAAVVYPQFGSVERSAFPPLYQGFTSRIGAPVVLAELAAFGVTLVLYAARPAQVPLGSVHALVALGVAYFAITFGWHLPSHRPLAAGDNAPERLAALLMSQWSRTVVQALRAGGLMVLLARCLGE